LKGASRVGFSFAETRPASGVAEIDQRMPAAGHAGSFVGTKYRGMRVYRLVWMLMVWWPSGYLAARQPSATGFSGMGPYLTRIPMEPAVKLASVSGTK